MFSSSERLDNAVTETFDNNEFLKMFKNFNITAIYHDMDESLAIDYERSHVVQENILVEGNQVLMKMRTLHQMRMRQCILKILVR